MRLGEEAHCTEEVTGFTKFDREMKFAARCEERFVRRNPELSIFPVVRKRNRLKRRGDHRIVEKLRNRSSVCGVKRPEY